MAQPERRPRRRGGLHQGQPHRRGTCRKPGRTARRLREREGARIRRRTIYPGLIDLHDHLSYNALQLWDVPKKFSEPRSMGAGRHLPQADHRADEGAGAHTAPTCQAIVRYVEANAWSPARQRAKGSRSPATPASSTSTRSRPQRRADRRALNCRRRRTHIADVESRKTAAKFPHATRSSCHCLLLHLSEGTDDAAREHFLALKVPSPASWAVTDSLAGIHCVALAARRLQGARRRKGGDDLVAAQQPAALRQRRRTSRQHAEAGVPIGLGPDWSPSGSKNLLGELKVARLVADAATRPSPTSSCSRSRPETPPRSSAGSDELGTLEEQKRADLLVVTGEAGDPHGHLFTRTEHDVELVVINGYPTLRRQHDDATTYSRPGRQSRVGDGRPSAAADRLRQPTADPDVGKLDPAKPRPSCSATDWRGFPNSRRISPPSLRSSFSTCSDRDAPVLVLDHDDLAGVDLRPHLPDPQGDSTAELKPHGGASDAAARPARAARPRPAHRPRRPPLPRRCWPKRRNLPPDLAAKYPAALLTRGADDATDATQAHDDRARKSTATKTSGTDVTLREQDTSAAPRAPAARTTYVAAAIDADSGEPEEDRPHRRADDGEPLLRPHARLPQPRSRTHRHRRTEGRHVEQPQRQEVPDPAPATHRADQARRPLSWRRLHRPAGLEQHGRLRRQLRQEPPQGTAPGSRRWATTAAPTCRPTTTSCASSASATAGSHPFPAPPGRTASTPSPAAPPAAKTQRRCRSTTSRRSPASSTPRTCPGVGTPTTSRRCASATGTTSLGFGSKFAYFDRRSLLAPRNFLDDAAAGKLPAVSWIDPNFYDVSFIGPSGSNDDHPPSDLLAGQELVLKTYTALLNSPNWSKTMLIITYDEHGGFYDHVLPPAAQDDSPAFRTYGVRVPVDRRLALHRTRKRLQHRLRPHIDHQDNPAPLLPTRRRPDPRHGRTRQPRKPPRLDTHPPNSTKTPLRSPPTNTQSTASPPGEPRSFATGSR